MEALKQYEKLNTGTSPTKNEDFDRDGYLVIKNLYDVNELFCEPPKKKGQYTYYGRTDRFDYIPIENQVKGSTSRYSWPLYKYAHSQIRLKLENLIGRKLYNTYYYDRFYNPGQDLKIHTDRPSCEISVTVHVSSNIKDSWPIWIKTPDILEKKGENRSVILLPGDGMVYKGCERPHWRNKMPGRKRNIIRKMMRQEELYYHQIFFHYVIADGLRASYAFDNQ